jgi:hypothetical protein
MEYAKEKSPAYNLRFGATAAVPRMNFSCEIELPCAAEMFVEAAASPSRCVVVRKLARERWSRTRVTENFVLPDKLGGAESEKV